MVLHQILFVMLLTATTTNALTVVITGTSQGIGLDAASRMIREGHTVVHACRSMERAELAVQEAGGGIPMECNLASLESIRSFAARLLSMYDTTATTSSTNNKQTLSSLDVLCLNAGIAPSTKSTYPKLSLDGFEECIATNHLGHFLLANLLKEKLSSSNIARLVVTASSVHDPEGPGGAVNGKDGATLGDLSGLGINLSATKDGGGASMVDGTVEYNGSKVYKDSKLCNILFCREAVKRWGTGDDNNKISVRSFNPGFIPSSGLFRAPREDNWFGATAFTLVAGLVGFAVPVEVGGARLAYMATASDDEVPNGSYYSGDTKSRATCKADGFDQASISIEASDDALSTKLWDRSMEVVGL
mmetsp:Transcript_27774/g.65196  ORF Transcript_27774/g.65196 Transcript_27774/m.65196 type:complete len:360 (-) Transcript_27774:120-1199(-)